MTPAALLAATGYPPAAPPTNESVAAMLCALDAARRAESEASRGNVTFTELCRHFRVGRTRLATAIQRARLAPITSGRCTRYDRAAALSSLPLYL